MLEGRPIVIVSSDDRDMGLRLELEMQCFGIPVEFGVVVFHVLVEYQVE